MIKKLFFSLLFLLALAAGAAGYAWQQIQLFAKQPLQLEQSELFTVKRGTSVASVVNQLAEQSRINNPQWSRLWLKLEPELANIKAGTYQISGDLSLRELLQVLVSGKEFSFEVRLVEGLTFKQWLQTLQQHPELEHELRDVNQAELMKKLGSERSHPEGLFFPDTYLFVKGDSDFDILRRAYNAMETELADSWEQRQEKLPYKTPYEALIMASIVEKETGQADERSLIAGVFVNRLYKKMRLQTDPTVIYGMGDEYEGRIRKRHLRTDTPYNTYTRFGLPPTPIAMPGKAAIDAAVQPEKTDYLYFVARGDGSHKFSRTLKEHNRAVNKYILGKN